MKKTIFLSVLISFMFASCLKKNTENVELFANNDINAVAGVWYRYVEKLSSGVETLKKVELDGIETNINKATKSITIKVSPTLPNIKSIASPARAQLSVKNIAVVVSLPAAARIFPVGDAPKLGINGDWSKPNQYRVQAANGEIAVWTISIAALIPPLTNPYDGEYISNGYLYHPTAPRVIKNNAKTAIAVNSTNSITISVGDLDVKTFIALFTVDPATNKVSIEAAEKASGAPYMMLTDGLPTDSPGYAPKWEESAKCNNTYDPATKTFYVRYGYKLDNVWRVTEEIIKLK